MKLHALAAMFVAAGLAVPGPVEIAPAHPRPDDPNGGRWFFVSAAPSQTASVSATIRNPSEVARTVSVYLRDLDFSGGAPQIRQGPQNDVGGWGRIVPPEIRIDPHSSAQVTVHLAVPAGAKPGDHIGAVVAETERRQIGVRIYVNVPGPARKGFQIEDEPKGLRWTLWPSPETVSLILRNTGDTTLPVEPTIAGHRAKGARLLVSQHGERYRASVPLPWFGGPVGLPIKVGDGEREVTSSIFVIPCGGVALAASGAFLSWLGVRRFRRRSSMVAALHAEAAEPNLSTIERSFRRARRTGSQAVLEKLALALHESGEDALQLLLEALERPANIRRNELIRAAASYGRVALLASPEAAKLPPDVIAELIE